MGRTKKELAGVRLLGGAKTADDAKSGLATLETFVNKHQDRDYWVTFTCPEFTSLCPVTGQPDFATIIIQYIPGQRMVESKSLKFYLFGFRDRGDFHEDCVNVIMKDLCRVMDPKYIEVLGRFAPRGGIAIEPFVNYGRPGSPYTELAAERFRAYRGGS